MIRRDEEVDFTVELSSLGISLRTPDYRSECRIMSPEVKTQRAALGILDSAMIENRW